MCAEFAHLRRGTIARSFLRCRTQTPRLRTTAHTYASAMLTRVRQPTTRPWMARVRPHRRCADVATCLRQPRAGAPPPQSTCGRTAADLPSQTSSQQSPARRSAHRPRFSHHRCHARRPAREVAVTHASIALASCPLSHPQHACDAQSATRARHSRCEHELQTAMRRQIEIGHISYPNWTHRRDCLRASDTAFASTCQRVRLLAHAAA